MRKHTLPFLLSVIVSISMGFYACILVKKFTRLSINSEVNLEINPFEIISLLTTIVLAIYVTRTLSKINDLENNEKKLITSYLEDFRNSFNKEVAQLLEQSDFDNITTNSTLKIIRKKLDSLLSLAVEHNFITVNEQFSSELKNKVRDIWEIFTNTPKKPNGRSSASVKEDIERLRLEQVTKIEATAIEVEKLLFQLSMRIYQK